LTFPPATSQPLVPPPHAARRIRFSLNDAPAHRRPDLYREYFGRSFRLDVEPLGDAPLEADVTLQALPGLHFFSGNVHGSHNRRTRKLLGDSVDELRLLVNLGGDYRITQGERELVLADGEATLVSLADLCGFAHRPPGGVLALTLPKAPFAPLVTGVEDCLLRRIPCTAPALRLLISYVDSAWDEQTISAPELQHLIVTHVYDLIAISVGATRETAETSQGRGLHAARWHAIKQDIGKILDRPDLSLTMLAARHACAPRAIQRLFETEGTTFTDYVLSQRLARAYRRLSDPRHAGEKISTVAYDAGFADLSYFNRAFRRCYGVSPSDIRAAKRHYDA
jgi:AraC-like DNA-binding protein